MVELRTLVNAQDLADFWNQVTDFRNFLNHGAMRSHWAQRPVKTVMDSSKIIYERFKVLAGELLEDTPCSS